MGRAGHGEPVVLIMGLGGSSRAWWRLLPHLAGYRAITLDNRRGEEATPGATILAQMVAVATHDVRARLHELAGLPGDRYPRRGGRADPRGGGPRAGGRHPGARLVTIPACGHMLTTDAEATATRAVREHLSRGAEGEAEAASFAA